MLGITVEITRPGSWCRRMGSVPYLGGCGMNTRYSSALTHTWSAGGRAVGQSIFIPQASGSCDERDAGQRLSLGAKAVSDWPLRGWGRFARIAGSRNAAHDATMIDIERGPLCWFEPEERHRIKQTFRGFIHERR
ncbi:hypothetical protein MRX96_019261 [Rhipicephalus microplus]